MGFTLENSRGNAVHSYQQHSITVIQLNSSDSAEPTSQLRTLNSSIIISPEHLVSDWRPQQLQDLQTQDMDIIFDMAPDVVLLGVGKILKFPPKAISQVFQQRGIGLEVMDTAAACRTYNFLLTEGRHVIAALLLIDTSNTI